MGRRIDKELSLLGFDVNALSDSDLATVARKILESKIHGLCFSPYSDDQKPGDKITKDQIYKKLEDKPKAREYEKELLAVAPESKWAKFYK